MFFSSSTISFAFLYEELGPEKAHVEVFGMHIFSGFSGVIPCLYSLMIPSEDVTYNKG